MSAVEKIIIFAVGLIFVVIFISNASNTMNTGKDAANSGNDSLTQTVSSISASQYDVYNGSTQTGQSVIKLINSTFTTDSVEILVCTKDGCNYVYNKANTPIFGAITQFSNTGGNASTSGQTDPYDTASNTQKCYLVTNTENNQFLSNIAQYDAKGRAFDCISGNQGAVATVQKVPVTTNSSKTTCTASGYNSAAPMTASGFISTSAYFTGSVQKDINGDVRRVTFVQK